MYYKIKGETLSSIANVIREKTGTTDPIAPEAMADKVNETYEAGKKAGGGSPEEEAAMYYAVALGYSSVAFPENTDLVIKRHTWPDGNAMFLRTSGLRSVKFITDTAGTTNMHQLMRESTDVETVEFAGTTATPTSVSYFALATPKLKSVVGALDMSQCTAATIWLNGANALEDIEFVPETIKISLSFEWCSKLTSESIISSINGLSPDVTGQTVTFNKTAVNNAFTTEEWDALVATKPNWTIALA